MKQRGEKFAMLTAYEQYAAQTFDEAGIEVLLVGDSASNNVFANETSLPVTVDELIPLIRAVTRSARRALVVADLPFGSYQASPEQAYLTAVRFMKEANAHCVKLEGGVEMAPQVRKLTEGGIPVMAHIGFTPQSEHTLGGYRVQGRGDAAEAGHRGGRGDGGGRRLRRRDGDGPRRRRRRGHPQARHPHHRHRRRRRAATARCSSGRTPSACAPAGWPSSSSSTPTCTACCSRPPSDYAADVKAGTFPGPEHTF